MRANITAADRLRALATRVEVLTSGTDVSQARPGQLDLLVVAVSREIDLLEAESVETMSPAARQRTITKLVTAYGEDADRSNLITVRLYAVLVLAVSGSAATIVVGLLNYQAPATNWSHIFLGYLMLSALLLLAAIPLWIQAERHRRAGAESRRLERQFAALDAYLEPMQEPARAIMRAALAPRLFSRLLEDNDPMREPLWPSADSLYPGQSEHRDAR